MTQADCRVLDEDRSRTPVRRRSRHAATERTGGLRFGIFALTLALLLAGCQGNQGAASNVLPAPSRTSAKSAERYDLAADELRGGHTVRRHVGRSDAELRERLDQERNISSASTWTNLEVAEETVAGDIPGGIDYLQALRGLGVRIAVDGFGTALWSARTRGDVDLPLDILRINVSADSSQGSGTPSEAALASLLRQASDRCLTVIAERIEDQEQLDVLRKLGCSMGQGFLLAWPATAHTLEEMLASGGLLQPEHAIDVSAAAGL